MQCWKKDNSMISGVSWMQLAAVLEQRLGTIHCTNLSHSRR